MENNVREDVAKVPEQEAAEVSAGLRKKLPRVPLSVKGFVDRKNRRLVHVSADHPENGDMSVDANYPADAGVGKIVAAAIKKITNEFAL